ncbi:hypothetical protein [Sphingomonas sp.]|uniref:hypothetical protein n=1 Tax=Sphingomonas sp. TaxID=28214 RepID=UPI002DD662D5|nr:hypothetical protein [Sphingomonas sp.]
MRRRSAFFPAAAALMTLVVFAGFLPSFYLRPWFRSAALPGYLMVHAIVMTLWQLLFLAQTVLVAAGRTDLHRALGRVGAALAVAVVVVGIHTTLNQPALYAARGIRLPFPLEELVIGNIVGFGLFAGLIAAAIVKRRDAATHGRLIYWACVVTMGPALTPSRALGAAIAPYFPASFPPEIALGWIAWIALLANDWLNVRRFHPATIVGGMLILFVGPALLDGLLTIEPLLAWARALA